MSLRIRPLATDSDRSDCYSVRYKVFVEEQNVPVEEEIDALDETAQHFVVEDDGAIIGTARLVIQPDGTGKIGRVALLKEYRGRGIGRELLLHVMGNGFHHCQTLVLDSQVSAIPFYEQLGFV